jgi:hypothetical protein
MQSHFGNGSSPLDLHERRLAPMSSDEPHLSDEMYRIVGPSGVEYQRARETIVETLTEAFLLGSRNYGRIAEALMARLAALNPPMLIVALEEVEPLAEVDDEATISGFQEPVYMSGQIVLPTPPPTEFPGPCEPTINLLDEGDPG